MAKQEIVILWFSYTCYHGKSSEKLDNGYRHYLVTFLNSIQMKLEITPSDGTFIHVYINWIQLIVLDS